MLKVPGPCHIGLVIINGVFGRDIMAAISMASAATPNCIPNPMKEPSDKSTPRDDTKLPSGVISAVSFGPVIKFQ